MNPLARADQLECAADETKVAMTAELQIGWFAFAKLIPSAPLEVCAKPYQSSSIKLNMSSASQAHLIRIQFTLHPIQNSQNYFISAIRAESLDGETFEESDSGHGMVGGNQPVSIELGAWHFFQRQNMRITFSI